MSYKYEWEWSASALLLHAWIKEVAGSGKQGLS